MRILSNDGKVVVVEDPSKEDLEAVARDNPGAQIVVVLREAEAPPELPKGLHPLEVHVARASSAVEIAAAQLRARRAQFHLEASKAVTRRDLLRGEIFVKRAVPQLSPELCMARFGCSECVDVCPTGALKLADRSVSVDPSKCTECGLCISSCPTGALSAPGADDVEIAAALAKARLHGTSRVVFTCYKSAEASAEGRYVYRLPCIGALGPEWVLEAAAAAGEVEAYCPDLKCPAAGAKAGLEVVEEVAEAFGFEKIESKEDRAVVRTSPKAVSYSGSRRRDYLEVLSKFRDAYTGRKTQALKMYRVDVDPSKCSLCGVCFAKCPQRAFDVSRTGDAIKLTLNPLKCVGCGYCEEVCPEKAIAVGRHDSLPPEVEEKAVDYVVRCKSCGRPFDTLRHIETVKRRMGIKGDPEWLYMCPDCRRYYTAKRMLESALGKGASPKG
ncbi:Iron-sulfur protein [Thermoproteus uzoniensis 768-20]|uniref:Iron-sulfur protein n=1 Tax=Thermoproteus uzoniensis (strain 768-20) TaxID=999630 RepID=F2L103_THEU7|nr:4Fe-4S binding protein [Thermoproteus uzoniensis]AEA11552.1 Iron-sulfur protein [Thermoproteus uzoniensis 768-20]